MSYPLSDELTALRRERDFLLRLLDIGRHEAVEPFLDEALALIVEMSEAARGYVELHAVGGDGSLTPEARWSLSHGLDDAGLDAVHQNLSSGIIADALQREQTVETACALNDARFTARASVRRHQIEAVLCVPVGAAPAVGVVYLQGASGGGPFGPTVRRMAELFAHHLAPVARRLTRGQVDLSPDPTAPWRDKLVGSERLVGRSAALAEVLKTASLVAPLELHLLLTGPSGTGKTALAEVIARNGPRANGPFLEVSCATIPEPLLENELFGAFAGAHATATRKIAGKVAAARGGTLFLDEIGELTLGSQSKLLQLLQSGTYYPLGSSQLERADVRVIAATNVDLEARVREGRFREDLLHRVRVMPIALPGLDARRQDIAPLARHFCDAATDRHGLPPLPLAERTLRALELADWPGNVRQLAHVVEAAVIRAFGDGAPSVSPRHAFPDAPERGDATSFYDATRSFQRRLLTDALVAHGWNVTDAAQALEMARSHAYALIKALDIERPT